MDQIPVFRKRLLVASSLTPVSPKVDTVILGLYWDYMDIVILGLYWDYIGVILGLYGDYGKENGNYYSITGYVRRNPA